MLMFPILSGALSVIFSLDIAATLVLQGIFMATALILPAIFVLRGKWKWKEIGFAQFNIRNCKKVFYFLPLLVILFPVAIKGFYIKSISYVLGNLFLYLFVGIAEEVYFRGIIPRYLKEEFSMSGLIMVSTFIFGIGHITTAFTGSNMFEIVLTVLNAFIFGWLAMEIAILASNILPAIVLHFLFDFETKVVVLSSGELLVAECVRGVLMFIIAVCFAIVIHKQKETFL